MPTTFGKYEIIETLGQGGMGMVYKARDPKLDRIVALKVLNPDVASPENYERFRREVQVLTKLRHPNIVRLLTAGVEQDRVYFTMEYIEGRSLADLIAGMRTAQGREALIRVLADVARAVHYAHEQGIIHRDLKPSNVIVEKGVGDLSDRVPDPFFHGNPIITDFGLARETESGHTITAPGAAVGTALYMSPEQAEGDASKIGPATDIYALGCILYEVLTGRPVFVGPTAAAILRKKTREAPISPRQINPSIGIDAETVCLTCLCRSERSRYATAAALAHDVERSLAGQPILAKRRLLRRLPRFVQARPRQWAMLSATALLLVAATIAYRATRPGLTEGRAEHRDHVLGRGRTQRVIARDALEVLRREAEARRRTEEERRKRVAAQDRERMAKIQAELEALARQRVEEARRRQEEARRRAEEQRGSQEATAEARFQALWRKGINNFSAAEKTEWREAIRARRDRSKGVLLAEARAEITSYYSTADVTCLTASDTEAWVGSPAGVFRIHAATGARWFYPIDGGVRAIAVAPDGTLWVVSDQGLTSYDGRQWSIHAEKDAFGGGTVQAFAVDSQGKKWLGTDHGLYSFDGSKWERYTKRDGLGDQSVTAIAIDTHGRKWFAGPERLTCFDGNTWATHTGCRGVTAISLDGTGRVWAVTLRGDVRSFGGTEWKTYSWKAFLRETRGVIWADSLGRTWFATHHGVTCFDETMVASYSEKDGLCAGRVVAICGDRRGRTWVATTGGVSCFDGKTWTAHPQRQGLPERGVRAIVIDQEGRKWVGAKRGLYCFDGRTWASYTEKSGLPKGPVDSMAVDARGRVWAATYYGVSCFTGEKWELQAQRLPGLGRCKKTLASDANGQIWAATFGGICCLSRNQWRELPQCPYVTPPEAVAVDAQGVPWVGTELSLFSFDGKTWRNRIKERGLRKAGAVGIAADGRKCVWVVDARGGVTRFDGKAWTTYLSQGRGVRAGAIPAATDHDGRLWVGMRVQQRFDDRGFAVEWAAAPHREGGGVSCFDGDNWRVWTSRDNLAGKEVTALAVDLDGSIWVGTKTGVSNILLKKKSD